MTDTLTRPKPRIDHPEALERVVARIVEAFEPVAIYLFDGRARGDADEDSDYDLMVVLPDEVAIDGAVHERLWAVARIREIEATPFLTTRSSFARRRHRVGTLQYEVELDGLLLHPDKPPRYPAAGSEDMKDDIVGEWLDNVRRDLVAARACCGVELADRGVYSVQQAAKRLTKAASVARDLRPRKGHMIGEFVRRLPEGFPLRDGFAALDRSSEFAWKFRYPDERGPLPEPAPGVTAVDDWIAEVEGLKTDFERWLETRGGASAREGEP